MPTLAAVVLAGGESRRFGSDKLTAEIDGRLLLELALDGLPAEAVIAVVGPERRLARPVSFVREDPPGGGPAAGLIAGLRWALDLGAGLIVTLPGDAPAGGRAAVLLSRTLARAGAVVGVDPSGRDQVLQLALRPTVAQQLIDLAGPDAGTGRSVHRLLSELDPPAHRAPLSADLCRDIDTAAQLTDFRNLDCT